MRKIIVIIGIAIGFLSFRNSDISNGILTDINEDSIKTFIVDDYPISNELLKGNYNEKISGTVISYDQAWFFNDTLKQTIVYRLYTDYHRLVTFHFYNNNIPNDLIANLGLNVKNGDLATLDEKKKNIGGFIKQAKKITQSHFTSNKGFKLGDKKEETLKIYGTPDKSTKTDGFEKIEWNFMGDMQYDGKMDLKGKSLAKNSFGHKIIMYFQNDKLIALILYNDVP